MKLLRRLKDRFDAFLYDPAIELKERTFVLFSVMEIIALIVSLLVGILLQEPLTSTVTQLIIIVVCILLLLYALRSRKLKGARIVVAFFLVGVLQPLMFFSKGGLACGTMLSILLGSYYLVLVLEGKFRIIMCFVDLVVLSACGIAAYLRPALVTSYSRESDYIYTYAKYIIIWLVLTAIIAFQTRIYQRENKIAGEKTRELEEMNRTQSRFFSSMSHEIRTPINTVLGLNEIILRQEDASEEIRRDARNIQGAGKMLLALINDILDVSKIEAGKMDIVPVNYSVSALLSEIVNMIWLKAEEKDLQFHVDIDPAVPETLFGDEVRIKQILINLLNNAVKYTREGSVSLHMECEFPGAGDALLVISVADTGMGIKPEALPHLFDSFQRVDEEKNRHIEGTGLGLSIVKQLVELMGGEISVNSVYTQGSTFVVKIRQGIASDKRIGEIDITNTGRSSGAERYEHSFHAPEARVLIVDDNEMNLQVEQKLIAGTEIRVDLAMSGAEALALTLKNRYDVIFMDHLMPEMDGITCFAQIRAQKGGLNNHVPVIVLTANAGGENIELYNNTGFDGYLVKPVSGQQLEDMLLAHLPADKVMSRKSSEMTASHMSTASGYAKKRPVAIVTSSMSDLPESVRRELQIDIIPYTVTTGEGVFFDNVDIDSEELVRYMGDENRFVTSDPPSEEALVRFFTAELKKAHHLIHISLTTGNSREHDRVVRVAKSFENVSVVNSECLSSATGILVMIAAKLAQQNLPVEKILSELEFAKKRIRCSFVIRSTDIMVRRGHISPFVNSILNTLWLRPVLKMKNDKLGVGRFFLGSERKCYENYIRKEFSGKVRPDTSFVFVTYVGMAEEDLVWIEEMVRQRGGFEHIIFQKASAGIASNCGAGSFGVLYLDKSDRDYKLSGLLTKIREEEERYENMTAEEETNDDGAEEAAGAAGDAGTGVADGSGAEDAAGRADASGTAGAGAAAGKWYASIPGIDPAAALKNSGSEETLLSVLKIYYDSYEAKVKEIRDYYEAQDWENYTIKVHALKSGSRLVGAMQMGTDAEALEMAGKRLDIDFIRAHHEALLESYRAIHDALAPEYGAGDDLPEIPADTLADAYAALAEFSQAKDLELARMVMDQVKEYRLPEADAERFQAIREKLSQMDWDAILAIVQEAGRS